MPLPLICLVGMWAFFMLVISAPKGLVDCGIYDTTLRVGSDTYDIPRYESYHVKKRNGFLTFEFKYWEDVVVTIY